MQVVFSIEVKVGNMITKVAEDFAAGVIALRVRRAEVGWDDSEDIAECHLVVIDLVVECCGVQGCEILVRPSVRCDLVSSIVHALDDSWVAGGDIINLSLSIIVTSNEESGGSIIALKNIEHMGSVEIWSIIERQGNISNIDTIVDPRSTIGNVANFCSCNCTGRCSGRNLLTITAVRVLVLTIRTRTVVFSSSAVAVSC